MSWNLNDSRHQIDSIAENAKQIDHDARYMLIESNRGHVSTQLSNVNLRLSGSKQKQHLMVKVANGNWKISKLQQSKTRSSRAYSSRLQNQISLRKAKHGEYAAGN